MRLVIAALFTLILATPATAEPFLMKNSMPCEETPIVKERLQRDDWVVTVYGDSKKFNSAKASVVILNKYNEEKKIISTMLTLTNDEYTCIVDVIPITVFLGAPNKDETER